MNAITYYVMSKQAGENMKELSKIQKKLQSEYKDCARMNSLIKYNDDETMQEEINKHNALVESNLNVMMNILMPRHYRSIATCVLREDQTSTVLSLIEEDYEDIENINYDETVKNWISELKKHEDDVYIYDSFGNIYSVDELVNQQLHLNEYEPGLNFEPLEVEIESSCTVGDVIDEEFKSNNKLQPYDLSEISVDTYVLSTPSAKHYVNDFFDLLALLPKVVIPNDSLKRVTLGQIIAKNYYAPFVDVPQSTGIPYFYSGVSEIEFLTVKTDKDLKDENGHIVFDETGKPMKEEEIVRNQDGDPIYRYKDGIPRGQTAFNMLNSSSKNVPYSLNRLSHGHYYKVSREKVLQQVLKVSELDADDSDDAIRKYIDWLNDDASFGLFSPNDLPLLPIPLEAYVKSDFAPETIQYIPMSMDGKYYVFAERD